MFRIPTHRAPTHPGEILLTEFLEPMGLTQVELADRIGVPFQRVNMIVKGKRAVTADTALRLSRLFDTSVDFWMNLQLACDVYAAAHAPAAKTIQKIKKDYAAYKVTDTIEFDQDGEKSYYVSLEDGNKKQILHISLYGSVSVYRGGTK